MEAQPHICSSRYNRWLLCSNAVERLFSMEAEENWFIPTNKINLHAGIMYCTTTGYWPAPAIGVINDIMMAFVFLPHCRFGKEYINCLLLNMILFSTKLQLLKYEMSYNFRFQIFIGTEEVWMCVCSKKPNCAKMQTQNMLQFLCGCVCANHTFTVRLLRSDN